MKTQDLIDPIEANLESDPRWCQNYHFLQAAEAFNMRVNTDKLISLKQDENMEVLNEFGADAKSFLRQVTKFCKDTRCDIKDRCVNYIAQDLNPLHTELVAKAEATPSRAMSRDTEIAIAMAYANQVLGKKQREEARGSLWNRFLSLIGRKKAASSVQ
ncbi:hypothetical protein KKA95_00340 [Patescibacteria group bacterium]|nr:hypothetical protein [Patescibacteria group bacterium]